MVAKDVAKKYGEVFVDCGKWVDGDDVNVEGTFTCSCAATCCAGIRATEFDRIRAAEGVSGARGRRRRPCGEGADVFESRIFCTERIGRARRESPKDGRGGWKSSDVLGQLYGKARPEEVVPQMRAAFGRASDRLVMERFAEEGTKIPPWPSRAKFDVDAVRTLDSESPTSFACRTF